MVEQAFVRLQALVTRINFVMLGLKPTCFDLPTADPMRVDSVCHTGIIYVSYVPKQGDTSLDQYDDSQHSSGIAGASLGGNGPINSTIARLGAGGASNGGVPWGSGMGGVGKGDPQHVVVPGGIWMPTPRTQGTNSFSPSSSLGTGGDGIVGGASRGGRGGGSMLNGSTGGFFGNDEPRCARCNHSDASDQAQVRVGVEE